MRVMNSLCVLAILGLSAAQFNGTVPEVPPAEPQQPQDESAQTGIPDMTGAFAMLANVQAQQQMSRYYGKLILDFQSASGWMQVAQGWIGMGMMEANRASAAQKDLEEAADLEEGADLEEDNVSAPSDEQYTQLERSTEMALLYVLKLLYLQAGNKLTAAHQSHYQTKIQLSMLQGMGGAHGGMSWILWMMYYQEALRVIGSGITIQKQDAWNTWLLHEIMETDEFGNSLTATPPETFSQTMKNSRAIAMQLYYTETMIDFQLMFLEYYMQSMMMYMMQGAYTQMPQQQQQPQQQPEDEQVASPTSVFLEEELMADPASPSKPFVPFMGFSPQYMAYMGYYIRWFAVILNMQAAHGLMMHAYMDAHPTADDSENHVKYASMMKMYAVYALQQWAYLRFVEVMLQLWGMFAGSPQMMHNGAAANSFVQTDAVAQSN